MSVPAEAYNPLALIDAAIKRDMSPEHLGKLMELQEKWIHMQDAAAFSSAMAKAQGRMKSIVADSKNTQTRSTYASLEATCEMIVPIYTEEGLTLSFGEDKCEIPDHCRVICDVSKGSHTKQYHLDVPLDGFGPKGGTMAMNKIQGKGSSISYARRYLMCMIFNVSTRDDNDGQSKIETIDGKQETELHSLLAPLIAAGKVDAGKFYAWLQVKSLADVTKKKFDDAVRFLKQKAAPPTPPPEPPKHGKEIHAAVKAWQRFALTCTLDQLNESLPEIKEEPKAVVGHVWSTVKAEAEIRGFVWSDADKKFVATKKEPTNAKV